MKSLKPDKDETTQAIDWRALEEKRITPPFKPAVNGLMDTKVGCKLAYTMLSDGSKYRVKISMCDRGCQKYQLSKFNGCPI